MASLTGTLSDAGLEPYQGRFPRLSLIPERPSAAGVRLILTSPVYASIVDATGVFNFSSVVSSDETAPMTRYTLRADWDAGRELDIIPGLYIPAGDWTFTDLLIHGGQVAPGAIAYGFGPPPPSLQGVLYIDITGPNPVYYVPDNGGI